MLAALALAAPPSARAGAYEVYSCRTPWGEAAPADGWSGSSNYVHPTAAVEENTCAQPVGGLVAALKEGGYPTRDEEARWSLAVPAGLTAAALTVWRAGDTDGGGAPTEFTFEFWLGGAEKTNLLEACDAVKACAGTGNQSEPMASENRVVVPAANLGGAVYASAACRTFNGQLVACNGTSRPGGDGYVATVTVYAADLMLEQATGPTVADVGGVLATAPAVSGMSSVTFAASDAGAGVYEALVRVDGALVERVPVDEDGGRCREVRPPGGGAGGFLYMQPCAPYVNANVSLDTTRLSNGDHELRVSVTDAAGNATEVLDRTIAVANASPCAAGKDPGASVATNAGASVATNAGGVALEAVWEGTRATAMTSSFGRSHEVVGRLTSASGAPVVGAPLEVSASPSDDASAPAASTVVRTGADGRFSAEVRGGTASRLVCVVYRGAAGAGEPLAMRSLRLAVRAPVRLTIRPRTASAGSSIRFSGGLQGGGVPAGGKQVILEARSSGSRWLQFKAVRSNARGRFHASYRFRFAGPASYEFRVLCEPEADYGFARGFSNVVRVRER